MTLFLAVLFRATLNAEIKKVWSFCPRRSLTLTAISSAKVDVKRPRHPYFPRKKLLAISKPVYPDKHLDTSTLWQDCPRQEDLEHERKLLEANDFELLYAKEMRDFLEKSQIILAFHFNSLTHYPSFYVRYSLLIHIKKTMNI